MYIGVDIGGTKVLVAALTNEGVITEQARFPTPPKYSNFVLELRHAIAHFKHQDFLAGGVGVAGRIDRQHGRRFASGKLAWDDVPVQADVERVMRCPIVIENDAKLAALSEAQLLKDHYDRVLYITISTGIGFGLVVNGVIDTDIGDRGGTVMMLEHKGKLEPWESFGSGRAIVKRYGKRASEIQDEATWKMIVRDLAPGMLELIALTEPEVIVIGGGVGTYFKRYGKLLHAELEKHKLPLLKMPVLRQAQRPEEAVVFGCYDLAKQTYGYEKATR